MLQQLIFIFRPGFVRINLPYFLDKQSMKFVLEAVSLVSEHAWKLLPQVLYAQHVSGSPALLVFVTQYLSN